MSWGEFWIIFGCCAVTMVICRVAPLFLLKGRELPKNITLALNLIPPAAFAALVANDILAPGMFAQGFWPAGTILIASLVVVIVALRTRSLLLCALSGVVAYGLLLLI